MSLCDIMLDGWRKWRFSTPEAGKHQNRTMFDNALTRYFTKKCRFPRAREFHTEVEISTSPPI